MLGGGLAMLHLLFFLCVPLRPLRWSHLREEGPFVATLRRYDNGGSVNQEIAALRILVDYEEHAVG